MAKTARSLRLAKGERPSVPTHHKPLILDCKVKPGQTPEAADAALLAAGIATNVVILVQSSALVGGVDLTACFHAVVDEIDRVNRGDLSAVEGVLTAQALTLNAMFTDFANRSLGNRSRSLEIEERYMRLSLKAQWQCRATLETLAAIKNPPVVFARQANIANGPQQVNNGSLARAGELSNNRPNKLLEAHGERLDGRPEEASRASDLPVASLGTGDRAEDAGGQSALRTECVPRQPARREPAARARRATPDGADGAGARRRRVGR